jgi:hypothetical protein
MTNCKTFNNFSFILLFCTFAVCENSNFTAYCVVDGNSTGITLNDSTGKDSTFAGAPSIYLDNSTITINLTQTTSHDWEVIHSNESNHQIDDIVTDDRWETFKNNHDFHTEFHEILKNGNLSNRNINFSHRTFNETKGGIPNQWYHLKLKKNKLECTNISSICYIPSNVTASQYYISNAMNMWKLHNYIYLHTNQSKSTETIYTKLENCTTIETGCFSMYLAMCPGCQITIQLNSSQNNITKPFNGNGKWKKEQFSLKNFTTCFNISITTDHIHVETMFWAIGDIAYLSSNLSCEENKRYMPIDNSSVTCENALNEKINITFSLPDYKKYSRNVIDKNATSVMEDKGSSSDLATSSFNPLYLLIILPIVFIASVLIFVYFKKRKSKLGPGGIISYLHVVIVN